ncbi:glycoside hydrolase family 6 protein [Frankia sp. AgB32]|uniref:glycoside hydrolase family 6 protein n=1 Tax=Frankia sp. AgB32 TaxID=631119 RepID=UPI00200E456C|nr:glycoside hydrolase family 6 protein [Frankia sp. AgB32]
MFGSARGVAVGVAVAAALAGCGIGGSSGGGAADRGTASARTVAAPDLTRCPAGVGVAAGDGQPVSADTGVGRTRTPRGPFLVDPRSQAAQQAAADPAGADAIAPLVRTPTAFSVGDWITDVTGEVHSRAAAARAGGTTAVFMVYGIPHRDVGAGYSAGGFSSADAYRQFTRQVAAGIGDTRAVIVLEPDSLGQIDQLPADQATERYALLRDAVDVYAGLPGTSVYLDGTNCGWIAPAEMARRLVAAGVAHARGFAVNVANYYRTSDEVARAEVLAGLLGDAHYIVDTSRNGRGPATGLTDAWCNPPGRGTGTTPTTDTGYPHADAFLWVKTPGASDGECGRNNPSAGSWWPQAAADLLRNGVG